MSRTPCVEKLTNLNVDLSFSSEEPGDAGTSNSRTDVLYDALDCDEQAEKKTIRGNIIRYLTGSLLLSIESTVKPSRNKNWDHRCC